MGRPKVYTSKEIIAALVKKKGMVYLAAELIGCEADTIYNRAKNEPEIAAVMRAARGKVVDNAEMKLFNALQKNQPWAIQMTLYTLGKSRGYVTKTETESTSKTTVVITEEIVDADDHHQQNDPPAPDAVPLPT